VFDNFIRKMLGSAKKQHCEIRITGNQNSLSFIHLEGIASKDKEFIVSAIDISKHRIVEDTLRKSELLLKELNATKDKFFSIIAHDLRGPFSSVIGYSDIIISAVERENYKDLPKYALIIQNASLQAMNLLSNLLIWSRLQTGKINPRYEKIDIRELLGDVINLMDAPIRKKSINISHNLSERMELLADREMLNNIFRNLISNAIKYSYPDGIINIDVTISAGFLHVVIQDNGMGIEPDRLSQLFRINSGFTTRGTQNEEGSGLGLLLCREFITKLRGKIWAESIAGEGSKFCFMIPLK
jgi:signal transduction histidine kinase